MQEDKRSITSANGFKSALLYALAACALFHNTCVERKVQSDLPTPKNIDDVLMEVKVLMSDNAPNEEARGKIIEGWVGRELSRIKCLHHTLMLGCQDVRKACHKVIVESIGSDR